VVGCSEKKDKKKCLFFCRGGGVRVVWGGGVGEVGGGGGGGGGGEEKYCFLRETLNCGVRRLLPELRDITICHIVLIFSLPLSVPFVQLLLRLLVTVLL